MPKNWIFLTFSALFSCLYTVVNGQPLPFVQEPSKNPLLAGENGREMGEIEAMVIGDELEIWVKITDIQCILIETHICDLPTPIATWIIVEETREFHYVIDIELVYGFICNFEGDEYVVAGHATVVCDNDGSEPDTISGYYEFTLKCPPAEEESAPSAAPTPCVCDESEDPEPQVCGVDECKKTDCIPRNVYGKVAATEYFNKCRNYCTFGEHCYDRATAMLAALHDVCTTDMRGPDGEWCDEDDLNPRDENPGPNCDDLAFKVIIRFPSALRLDYHIATVVKTCEDGLCIIDPVGQPADSPTTNCVSILDWAKRWAGGRKVEYADTLKTPPAGKVYIELAPGNQWNYVDTAARDPTSDTHLEEACDSLERRVKAMCKLGRQPFPIGCDKDSDGDGIPDKYDKCKNSKKDAVVDYCNKNRFGCAEGEQPDE